MTHQLRIKVLRGTGLAPKDPNGLSDPYVVISLRDKSLQEHRVGKTNVVKKDLNPEWDEHFQYALASIEDIVLTFKVWDYDRIGKDDEMGMLSLFLPEVVFGKHTQTFDLRRREGYGGRVEGSIALVLEWEGVGKNRHFPDKLAHPKTIKRFEPIKFHLNHGVTIPTHFQTASDWGSHTAIESTEYLKNTENGTEQEFAKLWVKRFIDDKDGERCFYIHELYWDFYAGDQNTFIDNLVFDKTPFFKKTSDNKTVQCLEFLVCYYVQRTEEKYIVVTLDAQTGKVEHGKRGMSWADARQPTC